MELNTKHSVMRFNDQGTVLSYRIGNVEMLAARAEERPLFSMRLRDEAGNPVDVDTFSFQKIACERTGQGLTFQFSGQEQWNIMVRAHIMVNPQRDWVEFTMDIKNDTDCYVEYIDYPEMTVPNHFVSDGGSGKLFWPAMEGCEIWDPSQRDSELSAGFQYQPVGYPSKGWEGFYPGPVQMQYMAFYSDEAGFYFAAHDPKHHPKAIEYHRTDYGVRMEYRTFLALDKHTEYTDSFHVVLKDGIRDWMDAAELYREYVNTSSPSLPQKLSERENLPEWLKQTPMVLIYPVRGEKDTGQMEPNCFFPYENALPVVDKYARELDTQILVLLMHWEGTAPWAPPYIWPPFGGEEIFRRFVDKVHASGNLVGLYASGIGWTDESVLWPEYQKKQYREEHGLIDIMCAAPDQSVPHSLICNGPIRWGYDMCPANPFVTDCVLQEITKVIDSNVDYLQYFDQNLGGMSELCYSKKHGHLPVHGKWAVDAMNRLYSEVGKLILDKHSEIVIGCEAAAAESYMRMLTFSDLRYNINFCFAKPIPAYAYVYHQYLFNFMGNANGFNAAIPGDRNPLSLHFRMAYSFVAGDVLTGVLNGRGELFWDWGTVWETKGPHQTTLIRLVQRLLRLRKGLAREYLLFGKMIRPISYQTGGVFRLVRKDDTVVEYPEVLSSAWEGEDGRRVQLFVNFTDSDKTVTLEASCIPVTEQGDLEPVLEMKVGKFDVAMVKLGTSTCDNQEFSLEI